jgi:membrane protease YdiL (CAAX protease family)
MKHLEDPILSSPPGEGPRVRSALLRLVVLFIVPLAAVIGAQAAVQAVSRASTGAAHGPAVLGAALLLSSGLASVYVALVHTLERRTPAELSLRRGLPLAAAGFTLGLAIFCTTYAVLWRLGYAQWLGFRQPAELFLPLASAILAGVGEELIFRGGVFRTLEGSLGTGTALVLSAALFGGLHALNHGATWTSTVAIALEAGVLLGAAYCVSRSLWLPIGLHIGWNFTEGGLFGAAVSGGRPSQGLIHMPLTGPGWATGGAFGPEASLIAVGVCLTAASVLLVLTVTQGGWVPMRVRGAPKPVEQA